MKILCLLLLLTSCSHFEEAKEYCKKHPLECKEKKKIHDIEVQAANCRNLEFVTGREECADSAAPK